MEETAQSVLEQLIAIPSVNPDHDGDVAHQGESRMAGFLERHLVERNFRVERLEITEGRPNVIARAGARNPRRRICFEAHMDTVAVVGMTVEPFEPKVENGRLYGRGSCDTKGPMAAALTCLTPERIQAADAAGCEIVFLGAIGEETGLTGAREAAGSGFHADTIIVLEPTGLCPVVAHKGAYWTRFRLVGTPGHASTPEGTVSAIRAAAEFCVRIQRQHDVSPMSHPLLGTSTLNVGRIQGGSAPNIVAASCMVDVDRRYLPGESVEQTRQQWMAVLDELIAEGLLVSYTEDALGVTEPLEPSETSFIQDAAVNVLKPYGRTVAAVGSAWCSDAVPLSACCSDIMVFGPGEIAQAHTSDEFIDLQELELGAEVLGDLLDAWIERQGRDAS